MPLPPCALPDTASCSSGMSMDTEPKAQRARNFVVAIDASEECMPGSWNAVKWALENLYQEGDVLHLLHVIPDSESRAPMPYTPFFQPGSEPFLSEELERSALNFIKASFMDLASCYRAKCEINLVKGRSLETVGDVICKKSEALQAALVIVPAHRKGFLAELFVGSVSGHVAKRCRQPTLVLPW